jgi:hypothetical protein
MKLVHTFFLFTAVTLSISSCKKTFSCGCIVPGFTDTTYEEAKGKTASEACDQAEADLLSEDCFPVE